MTTTKTTDLLDLGLDDAEADTNANEVTATIPNSALTEAEATLSAQPSTESTESYNVIDMYPEVQLPQEVLSAISCDESLVSIQEQVDYLEAELQASRNALHNQIMNLTNKAKSEVLAAQTSADESLVTNALGEPEMVRVMASVLRIMQQHGKAGLLIEALDTIENGTANNVLTRLATTIAPQYETPVYKPTTHNFNESVSDSEPVTQMEPIQTTAAPTTRKRAKWVPN